MKKVWILLLVLILLLAGLFFWKGGHHALVLADVLEEYLDADNADQILTVQFQQPNFPVNDETGQLQPEVRQWTFFADSFWTEYADERIFGLTAEGVTAYLCDGNLYLDTGKAYALPKPSDLELLLDRLAMGLLLYGRVTKNADTYHLSMKTEELELSASVTADHTVRAISLTAVLPDGTAIRAAATEKETTAHPIPQAVADAMAQARLEPPMSLSEPLEVLLPAAESLLPLSADLKLGVSSGILELSETVRLTIEGDEATLTRKGSSLSLELPMSLSDLSPVAMAALLLREGTFTKTGDGAQITVDLSAEAATELLEALVPQAAELGITLGDSSLELQITEGRLSSASISAEGSVPFLFTTIPVDFSAELTVS